MLTVNLDFFLNKQTSFYNEIIFDSDIEKHGLLNYSKLGKCQCINHSGNNNTDHLVL